MSVSLLTMVKPSRSTSAMTSSSASSKLPGSAMPVELLASCSPSPSSSWPWLPGALFSKCQSSGPTLMSRPPGLRQ